MAAEGAAEGPAICGLWQDAEGAMWMARAEGEARVIEPCPYQPFVWLSEPWQEDAVALEGEGVLRYVQSFANSASYKAFMKQRPKHILHETFGLELNQCLLQQQWRYFQGMPLAQVRRMQVDIETASSPGSFSNAHKPEDRVLAIGMAGLHGEDLLLLEEKTDEGERDLLQRFAERLQEVDPDVIEGHNIFKFDLEFLRIRCKRLQLPCAWGRAGQVALFRNSRLRIAERWIDFPRCDIPGRTVLDTFLMIQLYDVTARKFTSYGLKDVAIALGVSKPEDRTYIAGDAIAGMFEEDRQRFCDYLSDDLRETRGVADLLLPTYVAQCAHFPMTLQEITLRGTGVKVDSIFLEKYYHQGQALPPIKEIGPFAGGFSKSFCEGVFPYVLHFDVASLYPSLLLLIGRNPASDHLGVFMPTLQALREYRLHYKKLAQQEHDSTLRVEYEARQSSFKILINSFYGYLGFGGARFADAALAAEVTEKGREILHHLIDRFTQEGCLVLEADTDGLYVQSEACYDQPEALLTDVSADLPEGIQLELDGRYAVMFCYKAKNYALLEGDRIIVKGAALKSRGMEPFLKELNDVMIAYLLGQLDGEVKEVIAQMRQQIESKQMDVARLVKSEYLSKSPAVYQKALDAGKGVRRAALEIASQIRPLPKMGDRVRYYITAKEKGKTSDWQRAKPYGVGDVVDDYDPAYYLKKIDHWLKRYQQFLPEDVDEGGQQEMDLGL